MCTLSFYPVSQSKCIITSNRDESVKRFKATLPQYLDYKGQQIVVPKDPEGGGSWVGVSKSGIITCLLNGAFNKHVPKPPYQKSRGIVLIESFALPSLRELEKLESLAEIEPFTMIRISVKPGFEIEEVRWDGKVLHYFVKDPGLPHIWSASLLYPPEVIRETENKYMEFLKSNQKIGRKKIYRFHLQQIYEERMKMLPGEIVTHLRTLSITSIKASRKLISMKYHDLEEFVTANVRLRVLEE